ncbi:MAG: acetyl-CoA decarbonylase/synthase complex subunit alpha/beta [Treponema sp.]|nr:acetyl-CoA decarbonylase/synthase complex subunit alpha/beta [Treponema sp.]
MKLLFNRVFDGADEMYALAEKALDKALAEYGDEAPLALPNTGYFLANHLAYLSKKITTLGELRESMVKIKTWMPGAQGAHANHLRDVFHSGYAAFLAAEVIEAIKYVNNAHPYKGEYHGHISDAEVRELGVPLVTGDIPGFTVIIGPAPSDDEAAEIIKGYQTRGIFVFLIGGIIDQARRKNLSMGFPVRIVPVGPDIWSVTHIISLVNRAAMIFGAVQPGDHDRLDEYTFYRIKAFVNAFAPVADIVVSAGAGAIAMGFPVITNDTQDMWKVPKSLIIQENTEDFIETSMEARDIKLKITAIDIPVAYSSAFEGEIIRRADMQVDIDGSRVDCFELVRTKDASEIEDHAIEIIGQDFDSVEPGSRFALGIIVEVAGKNMQSDFEPVFERRIHYFINCTEGIMHTGQRDLIRVRISKAAFEVGFRARHLGEVLYAKMKNEYESVIDKCQIKIYTKPDDLKKLRTEANIIYNKRDARLASLTDENVNVFYNCILCQSFSPAHVCVVTPERLGLCGAVSWLDAKATNELNPNGPCHLVKKDKLLDERLGAWEDVNEAVNKASHGNLNKVTLYSILTDPMTSCGCFECICGIEPASNGVVIVNREHTGMTPLGMTFSEMATMTGGGIQTPGFMGHGKYFIASKKFIMAEGGSQRIVWMPKALKDLVAERLNKTVSELNGIENFTGYIADETIAEDTESLMQFLNEKNHPALAMEPLL